MECKTCQRIWSDEFKLCPLCGATLHAQVTDNKHTTFNQQGQHVSTQINVAGNYNAAPPENITQKKHDALINILGCVVPDMQAILNRATFEPREALKEEIKELHKQVEDISPFFYSKERVYVALTRLGNLVGSIVSPHFKITQPVFDIFYEDIQVIKNELLVLEAELSKDSDR